MAYAGINAWEKREGPILILDVYWARGTRSEVLARVHARIYKASVHIVITILCWNWEGRFPISILMASGISSGACAKRRVITCIPPKKNIGRPPQAGLRFSFFTRCVFI